MKIRSITYFMDTLSAEDEQETSQAGDFTKKAREAYEARGYEVQTTRLATGAFGQALRGGRDKVEWAAAMETRAMAAGFGYLSLGPAYPANVDDYGAIPAMIGATENTFFSGMMNEGDAISMAAIKACAQVITETANIEADGFANLRFAATANMPPGSPFFPAGYHGGGAAGFAIATEAADLAVAAFSEAGTIEDGQKRLVRSLEEHGELIGIVGERLANEAGATFGGIDFSLAPFPDELLSIGTAFERMGVSKVGKHGSLAAAAILTEALERARYPRAGISGLMMTMLEDSTLAKRGADGLLGVKDLLVYSAVCGTGLDTVPIPGDTSVDQLTALLLDVAALSQRLGKPLTARMMPVPGKQAGEETAFDFPFFANSRVLAVEAEPLSGLLSQADGISLKKRAG